MKEITRINTKAYGPVVVLASRYQHGHRIAVLIEDETTAPISHLSINLEPHGFQIEDSEFHVNAGDNENLLQDLLKAGVFSDTGRTDTCGSDVFPVWKFVDTDFAKSVPRARGGR